MFLYLHNGSQDEGPPECFFYPGKTKIKYLKLAVYKRL